VENNMTEDSQLKQDVIAELNWEPSVTSAHIGVTARNGVVTLTGHVANYPEKFAAEAAVRRVHGVKGIAEELEVHLSLSMKKSDDEIAAAALDSLSWNVFVPRDAVAVKVEKGWVTLTGHVEKRFQREAASRDIRHLLGVVGVSNEVQIQPKVNTALLSAGIESALHRSFYFAEDQIHVTSSNGTITLAGSVDTFHERDMAGAAAWAAPGAVAVENNITIS
jgi:osmotically-inducible protein OsmY